MKQIEKSKKIKLIISLSIFIAIAVALISAIVIKAKITKNATQLDPELARAMTYGEFTDEDEKIEGVEGITFNAFFLKDLNNDGYANKVKGTAKKIGDQDSLYMSVNISGEGQLKNGKIEILAENFYFQTALIEDEFIAENYVSNNTNTIELKDMNAGSQKLLFGNVRSGDYSSWSKKVDAIGNNINNYSKINQIKFTGIYVNDDGEETEFEKRVDLTVDWYNESVTEIPTIYNKDKDNTNQNYDLTGMLNYETNEIELTFKTVIQEKNYLNRLLKSNISGKIPELNGYKATRVEITGTGVEYSYDDETQEFVAWKNATVSKSGEIIQQCYSGTYEANRFMEFNIKVTYPMESYTSIGSNTISYALPVKGWFDAFNNPNDEFQNPVSSNIAEGMITALFETNGGDVLGYATTVGKWVGGEYRDYVISKNNAAINYTNNIENEDLYEVTWNAARGKEGTITSLMLKETPGKKGEYLLKTDGTEISMENITTIKGIYLNNPESMLDKDNGYIEIYNDDTNELLHRFDSSDWNNYSKDEAYYFSGEIRHIRVETSETKRNSGITIHIIKEIDTNKMKELYTKEEFDTFTHITSYLTAYTKNTDNENEEYNEWNNKISRARYEESKSIARISNIDPTYFSTQETTNKVNITLSTIDLGYNTTAWINGEFVLKFPKEILEVNINSITTSSYSVDIIGQSIEETDEGMILRIITENEREAFYDILINCDITPDPRVLNANKNIELYSINENNPNYNKNVEDIYDIDQDGDTKELVGKVEKSIQLIGPASLATMEIASEYDDIDGEIKTTITPKLAYIAKEGNEKTAKITAQIINNYSGNIDEITIIGVIPFEGNKYILNGQDMNSMYTTTLIRPIQIPEELKEYVTVYYSENEVVTNEINNSSNNWIEESNIEDFSKIKTYLIDLGEYSMEKGESHGFSYIIKLPEELDYEDIAYSSHATYFSLRTDEGKLRDKTEVSKLGFMIAKKYDLQINKVKENTTIGLENARYQLTDTTTGENKILRSDNQGVITFSNLYVARKYILEEIKAPNGYEINSSKIEFESAINENNELEISILNGQVKKIEDIKSQTIPGKILTLENSPKFNLNILKLEENTTVPLSGVEFTLQKLGVEYTTKHTTDNNGMIKITNLEMNTVYELKEIKANGYYLPDLDIKFKIYKEDDEYKLDLQKGKVKTAQIIQNNDSLIIPELRLEIENKKIPEYSLLLTKYSSKDSETKLANASFKITGDGIEGEAIYKTDENGQLTINNLYAYVEGEDQVEGIYTIKEYTPPGGYALDEQEIKIKVTKKDSGFTYELLEGKLRKIYVDDEETNDISIDNINGTISLGVENTPLFTLTKVDGTTLEKLPGTKFAIFAIDENGNETEAYDLSGNLVGETQKIKGKTYQIIETDKNGEISLELQKGVYKIIEVEAIEGYELPEELEDRTYYFGIGETQDEVKKWINTPGKSNYYYYSSSKEQLVKDNGYLGVGYYKGHRKFNSNQTSNQEELSIKNDSDSYYGSIIKYDNNMKIEWIKEITGEASVYLRNICETEDGYFISGYSMKGFNIDANDNIYNKEIVVDENGSFIIKLNPEYKVEYINMLGLKNMSGDLNKKSNGNYIYSIIGTYDEWKIKLIKVDVEEEFNNDNNGYGLHIIEFDKNGRMIKSNFIKLEQYTYRADFLVDSDDNYFIICNAYISTKETYNIDSIYLEDNKEKVFDVVGGRVIFFATINSENGLIKNIINIPITSSKNYIVHAIEKSKNMLIPITISQELIIPAEYTVEGKEIKISSVGENNFEKAILYYDYEKGKISKSLVYLHTTGRTGETVDEIYDLGSEGYLIKNGTPTNQQIGENNDIELEESSERIIELLKFDNNDNLKWYKTFEKSEIISFSGIQVEEEKIIIGDIYNKKIIIDYDGNEIERDSNKDKLAYKTRNILTVNEGRFTEDEESIFSIKFRNFLNIDKDCTEDGEEINIDLSDKEEYVSALIKENKEYKISWVKPYNELNEISKFIEYKNYIYLIGKTKEGKITTKYQEEIETTENNLVLLKLDEKGEIEKAKVIKSNNMTVEDIKCYEDRISLAFHIKSGTLEVDNEIIENTTTRPMNGVITYGIYDLEYLWVNYFEGYGSETQSIDNYGNTIIYGGQFNTKITISAERTTEGRDIVLVSKGKSESYIVKLDGSGLVEWAYADGGTEDESIRDVMTLENGDIITTWVAWSNYEFDASRTEDNTILIPEENVNKIRSQ